MVLSILFFSIPFPSLPFPFPFPFPFSFFSLLLLPSLAFFFFFFFFCEWGMAGKDYFLSLHHLPYHSCYWSHFIWKKSISAFYFHLEKGKWHKLERADRWAVGSACIPSLFSFSFVVVSFLFSHGHSPLSPTLGIPDWKVIGKKSKSAVLGLAKKLVVLGVACITEIQIYGTRLRWDFFC